VGVLSSHPAAKTLIAMLSPNMAFILVSERKIAVVESRLPAYASPRSIFVN
jgi:hypothetical protein